MPLYRVVCGRPATDRGREVEAAQHGRREDEHVERLLRGDAARAHQRRRLHARELGAHAEHQLRQADGAHQEEEGRERDVVGQVGRVAAQPVKLDLPEKRYGSAAAGT